MGANAEGAGWGLGPQRSGGGIRRERGEVGLGASVVGIGLGRGGKREERRSREGEGGRG